MHRRVLVLAVALAAIAPSAVSAEPDPKAAWRYRHGLFEGLALHLMDASYIADHLDKGRTGDLLSHAIVMHETSKLLTRSFVPGTGSDVVPESRAKPEIWADEAGFAAALTALQDSTARFVKVAKKKDVEAVKAGLEAVGAACGGCHQAYRGPKPQAPEEHAE